MFLGVGQLLKYAAIFLIQGQLPFYSLNIQEENQRKPYFTLYCIDLVETGQGCAEKKRRKKAKTGFINLSLKYHTCPNVG